MGNIDGCYEHYREYMVLYLLSMLSQAYYVLINPSFRAPGYRREILDSINATEKMLPFQVMANVQHPGSIGYYT